MSRRPKLDISAVKKVDAVPLRKAIELHEKALSEIEKAKARKEALDKEVAEWMDNTDPDDTERINLIAGRRIQAEVIPGLVRRMEQQIERELSPKLIEEADKFRSALSRFYGAARKAVAEQLSQVLLPYFERRQQAFLRDGAEGGFGMHLALQSDDCLEITERLEAVRMVQLPSVSRPGLAEDPTHLAQYDKNVIEAAKRLIELAEQE